MDSFRITLPELHYHFSYTDLGVLPGAAEPDGDPTLAIDAQFESHLNRQAMLCAQALLRGDDEGEQVW